MMQQRNTDLSRADTRSRRRAGGGLARSSVGAIALGALIAACGTAQAQRYERVLGAPNTIERAFDVEEYRDGGSVTAGVFADPAGNFSAVHVVRYNQFGLPIWDFIYDRPGRDQAYSVDIAPNGDIVVAGWSTDDAGGGGAQTLVMRLDPLGNVIWSNVYLGTAGLFPLHTEEHGPQVVVGDNGAISVISNFQGLAVAFQLNPAGGLAWSNLYFDPTSTGEERNTVFAFTDIKQDDDGTLVVSGTARIRDITGALPFDQVQDPMLVRLDPGGGFPIAAVHYNLSNNADVDTPEVGEGLDLNRERQEIVLAGENLIGAAALPPQLVLRTDAGFGPLSAGAFGGPNAPSETGSAAVRFSADFQQFAVAGRDGFPGGPATLTAFDAGGAPIVRYNSFDVAEYDSVAESRLSCGFFAAGRTGAVSNAGDLFYAKTNDGLQTTCNQRVPFPFVELEPRPIDLPMKPIVEPVRIPIQFERNNPLNNRLEICFDAFCELCLADWDMNGVVDIFDVLAFLADWSAMNPRADLDMDGAFTIFDILAFLNAFNSGCV